MAKGPGSKVNASHHRRCIPVELDSDREIWYNAKDYCTFCQGEETPRTGSNDSEQEERGDDEMLDYEIARRKKKKIRRISTICTVNCRFDLVRQIARKYGMKEVRATDPWNIYWTDFSISTDRVKDMKRYQKVNHFPGMSEICRKDLLARNLNRMMKLFPNEYNIFPRTWCLPFSHGEVIQYAKNHKNKTFILKPETGCRGQGIYLTKNIKELRPIDRTICQVYISNPFLIDEHKFDLRVYALITSLEPLRVYVYNEGLARFATTKYREPNNQNVTNMYMHLTNYSVNKHSRSYVVDEDEGSKRRISTLNQWFEKHLYNVNKIWDSIDEVIMKTILSAYPTLKHAYQACFPHHDYMQACFEILGFDILLDDSLKPFLIEVNHSPSFHTDAQIDKEIKDALLSDTFSILNLPRCDRKRITSEDKRRITNRSLRPLNPREQSLERKQITAAQKAQNKWEDRNMGNFRKVYPSHSSAKYDPFFQQNSSTLYQDVPSKVREEAIKAIQETVKFHAKIQEKEKIKDSKTNFQSDESATKPKKMVQRKISTAGLHAIKHESKQLLENSNNENESGSEDDDDDDDDDNDRAKPNNEISTNHKKSDASANGMEKSNSENASKIKREKAFLFKTEQILRKIYAKMKKTGISEMENQIRIGRSKNSAMYPNSIIPRSGLYEMSRTLEIFSSAMFPLQDFVDNPELPQFLDGILAIYEGDNRVVSTESKHSSHEKPNYPTESLIAQKASELGRKPSNNEIIASISQNDLTPNVSEDSKTQFAGDFLRDEKMKFYGKLHAQHLNGYGDSSGPTCIN